MATRVTEHIEAATTLPVQLVPPDESLTDLDPASLVFGFGDTPSTRTLIPVDEVTALGSEGFVLRSGTVAGASALVADGNAIAPDPFGHASLGDGYAAMHLLEELGFAFLHPLAPTRPPALAMPAGIDRSEAPHWPFRALQLHTMHPTRADAPAAGLGSERPGRRRRLDRACSPSGTASSSGCSPTGKTACTGSCSAPTRGWTSPTARSASSVSHRLVGRGHEFGLWIGADAPLVQHQQHTWRLIQQTGELADEVAQIHDRVDHLMASGFDYFATESGTTEFTSSDDQRMVAWMDALAAHVDEAHDGRETFIKIHASTGQTVENYKDPETDEPLNFNFLPHFADPRMGVMPHTVQHYGLDDPAPTYGNTDYAFMREFLQEEVGLRKVVWHPETAYWVSFDIDTPLFLPVYAERRLHDLRTLGRDELAGKMGRGAHAGGRMDGQSTFSSGWEWGYWLPEVVTARAAWNPRLDLADDAEALRVSLAPVVRPFGPVADQVSTLLVETIAAQRRLLILGLVDGVGPDDITKRNGQAYMQGFEAWDDISDLAESVPGLDFTDDPARAPRPGRDARPASAARLLGGGRAAARRDGDRVHRARRRLRGVCRTRCRRTRAPSTTISSTPRAITALRATQIHGLYDYVDGLEDQSEEWRSDAARGSPHARSTRPLVVAKAARAATTASTPTASPAGATTRPPTASAICGPCATCTTGGATRARRSRPRSTPAISTSSARSTSASARARCTMPPRSSARSPTACPASARSPSARPRRPANPSSRRLACGTCPEGQVLALSRRFSASSSETRRRSPSTISIIAATSTASTLCGMCCEQLTSHASTSSTITCSGRAL